LQKAKKLRTTGIESIAMLFLKITIALLPVGEEVAKWLASLGGM